MVVVGRRELHVGCSSSMHRASRTNGIARPSEPCATDTPAPPASSPTHAVLNCQIWQSKLPSGLPRGLPRSGPPGSLPAGTPNGSARVVGRRGMSGWALATGLLSKVLRHCQPVRPADITAHSLNKRPAARPGRRDGSVCRHRARASRVGEPSAHRAESWVVVFACCSVGRGLVRSAGAGTLRCCRFAALAAKDEAVAQSARCDSSVPAFFWAQKQARLLCWVSSKAATVSQPLGCGELDYGAELERVSGSRV